LGWLSIIMVVGAVSAWTVLDLAKHPVWLISWGVVGFAGLVVEAVNCRSRSIGGVARIMVVAALLRGIGLLIVPTLSSDIYRYAWDGQVALSGANPYLTTPDATELIPLRSALWQRVDHRDIPTVYPPLALASFALASAGPIPIMTLKVMYGSLDLLSVWLLIGILRNRAIHPGWAVGYAWNPLVVLETAGMGHVDSLGVLLLLAAVASTDLRRERATGLAVAGAVLAKAVPVVALPLWLRSTHWVSVAARSRFVVAALATLFIVSGTWLWRLGGIPPGWFKFGVSWEFNGPLFEPLWRTLGVLAIPDIVTAGLDTLKDWTGQHGYWNRFYPYNYPQFLAKLLLAGSLAWFLVRAWQAATLEIGLRRVFFGVLLFSATVYPWYLLWVLPWAVVTRRVSYLVLSALALISYVPQLMGQPVFPLYWSVMWGGFGAAWLAERWRQDREHNA